MVYIEWYEHWDGKPVAVSCEDLTLFNEDHWYYAIRDMGLAPLSSKKFKVIRDGKMVHASFNYLINEDVRRVVLEDTKVMVYI